MTPAQRRPTLRLVAGSLMVGLLLEAGLTLVFGPITALGASRSFGAWLLAMLVSAGSGGIGAWFARWLAAELTLAWLLHRLALGAAPDSAPPPLAGRWLPYLTVLAVVALLVFGPVVLLMALGVPVWLALLFAPWPLVRLSLARQAVALTEASAWGALAGSWRLTRRRELFAALFTLLPLLPVAALWLGLYVAAAYLPLPFAAAWWLAVSLFWAYLPLVAALWLSLWDRLRPGAAAGDDAGDAGGGVPGDDEAPAPAD